MPMKGNYCCASGLRASNVFAGHQVGIAYKNIEVMKLGSVRAFRPGQSVDYGSLASPSRKRRYGNPQEQSG